MIIYRLHTAVSCGGRVGLCWRMSGVGRQTARKGSVYEHCACVCWCEGEGEGVGWKSVGDWTWLGGQACFIALWAAGGRGGGGRSADDGWVCGSVGRGEALAVGTTSLSIVVKHEQHKQAVGPRGLGSVEEVIPVPQPGHWGNIERKIISRVFPSLLEPILKNYYRVLGDGTETFFPGEKSTKNFSNLAEKKLGRSAPPPSSNNVCDALKKPVFIWRLGGRADA